MQATYDQIVFVNALLFPDVYYVFSDHRTVFSIAVSALLHLTFARYLS